MPRLGHTLQSVLRAAGSALRSDGRRRASHPAAGRLVVLVGLIGALLSGCAGNQQNQEDDERTPPGQTDLRVASLRIEGVEAFPVPRIKRGLATRVHPGWRASPLISWIPLLGAEPSYFNTLEWRRDLERIRIFYHARGYFDARITRRTIVREPEKNQVHLRVRVQEGEPYPVEEIEVEGLETVETYTESSILEGLALEEGERFTEEAYLQTKAKILERLEQKGHAYAEVAGRAFIVKDAKEARVRYVVDAGPQAVFGEVDIQGLESVPERYVRQAVTFEPGDPYSSDALQNSQEAIYNLEVFSLVSVMPAYQAADGGADGPDGRPVEDTELSEDIELRPESGDQAPGPLGVSDLLNRAQNEAERRTKLDRRVPIVIRVKEARPWSLRVGAGIALESNRQDVHAQVDVSSKNVFGGLQRLDFSNKIGYAWAPGLLFTDDQSPSREGIILRSQLQFIQPWFGRHDTQIRFTPTLERDIRLGYKFWNPAARIGIDRTFFRRLTLGLGYRISYYNFDAIDPDLTVDTPLGQDFQPEFILEYLEQTANLDYRDNPLNPTSGFLSQLTIQEATDYIFNGEFTYLKLQASTSGYIPVSTFTDVVLAMRFRAGTIYNLEPVPADAAETQRVPTINRFYSGGRGAMRTVGRDRLSIYLGRVPVGGSTVTELSFEPRFELVDNLAGVGDLWAAPFADAGTVLEGPFLLSTSASQALELGVETPRTIVGSLIYGVGAGIWWVTPIGPVRADFGYTLTDLDADPRFPDGLNQFNFIIGIGHSF